MGVVFLVYSVAVIIASPVVGSVIPSVGTTNLIALGIGNMGVCFGLFGIIDDMDSVWHIIAYSLLLRLVQGGCSAFVQTTCYCIATTDFPDRKEEIVGLVEAMTGIGCIVGPLLGSALYQFLGFKHTFLVYGSFLVFLAILIKLNFPQKRLADATSELGEFSDGPVHLPFDQTIGAPSSCGYELASH